MLKFLKAFAYAFNGLVVFFRHERNGKIQLAVALLIVVLGFWVRINLMEWMFVLACVGAVLSLEMLNSALEKMCNLVHPTYHPAIKVIKDLSAGAVLFSSLCSATIGIIIFLPKVLALFR